MKARVALAIVGLAASVLVGGCTAQRNEPTISQPAIKPLATFSGKATWYGGRFQGRKTASGERFDKNEFTCAHRTLPFGTIVRVTNLETNRSVMVRVNDRGPYGKGRIVDVSEAAAEKLGMIHRGVVQVRLDVMKEPAEESP